MTEILHEVCPGTLYSLDEVQRRMNIGDTALKELEQQFGMSVFKAGRAKMVLGSDFIEALKRSRDLRNA